MCPRRGNRTSLLSQAHHVDVFACGEERKQPSCYDDRSGIVCSCHFYWWLPCLSPGFDWLMQISFPFPFFVCDRAQDYPCPSTHSLPISALGHCHLSVSVCLCSFFFLFFFPPIWPLDDETAAPVFWHELSLHIRPLWWRLSAWHARICPWLINPHTHTCALVRSHTQIHTSPLAHQQPLVSFSLTHTRCPTQLSITAPEKVGWTIPVCVLGDTSDRPKKKRDTHVNPRSYCRSTITIISCLHLPFKYKHQAGICIQTLYIYACIRVQSHMPGHSSLLLLIWYTAQSWIQLDWSCVCSPANGR